MERLIDTDEFMETVLTMKRLNEECPLSNIDLENEEINNYETGQRETFELIIGHLEKQPTAYDPDKVVEQLEEEVKEYDKRIERRNGDCYFDETEKIKALEERARGIERAIEIVKGGGVDA